MQRYRFVESTPSYGSTDDDISPLLYVLLGILLLFIMYRLFKNAKPRYGREYMTNTEDETEIDPEIDLVSHPKLVPMAESEAETGAETQKGSTTVPVIKGYNYDQIYAYNNIVSYNDEDPLYDSVFKASDVPAEFSNYTDDDETHEAQSRYKCAADLVNLSEGRHFSGKNEM